MVKELASYSDICVSLIARTDISRQSITNTKTKPRKLFPGEIKAVTAVFLLLQETCIPSKELRGKILNTENNEYFKDPTN